MVGAKAGGVYVASFGGGAGREQIWSESGYVRISDIAFQVCDYCAPHSARGGGDKGQVRYWNMTEHIPSVLFVQSTRRKRPLKRTRFRFLAVKEAHFFGVIKYTVDGFMP